MPHYFWKVIEVQAPRVIFTDIVWFGGLCHRVGKRTPLGSLRYRPAGASGYLITSCRGWNLGSPLGLCSDWRWGYVFLCGLWLRQTRYRLL